MEKDLYEIIGKLINGTQLTTCECLNCEENEQGKCALREIVVKKDGSCGWYIPE